MHGGEGQTGEGGGGRAFSFRSNIMYVFMSHARLPGAALFTHVSPPSASSRPPAPTFLSPCHTRAPPGPRRNPPSSHLLQPLD